MIKHVVLLHWKEGTTTEAIQAVSDAFAQLPALVAEICSYEFGPDLGVYPGNADYMVVATFDSREDFKAYVVHPEHTALMKEVTMPIMASFSSAQIEL